MSGLLKQIPNILTLLNLLSGCLGVAFAFAGYYPLVVNCLIASLIFDFLDGTSARLIKAQSPLGKQLDSLADVISFGFMPAALIFQFALAYWFRMGDCVGAPEGWAQQRQFFEPLPAVLQSNPNLIIKALPVFLFTALAAVRLGNFNIDEDQSEHFLGLPSPAAAALIVGLVPLHFSEHSLFTGILFQPIVIFGLPILAGFLMLISYPMFSLKFKREGKSEILFPVILLLLAIILLIVFKFAAISLIVLAYLLLAAIHNLLNQWNSSPK